MHEQLVNQTAVLDDLLERSRNSMKRKSPSRLSKSLEFSILSDSNAFSTTTWIFDNEKDEPPATSFLFDHELNSTKVYRRAVLNRLRKNSSQNSSKQFIDEPKISDASNVSDGTKHEKPQSLEKVCHLILAVHHPS